jgi:hypothetical protein
LIENVSKINFHLIIKVGLHVGHRKLKNGLKDPKWAL